MGGGKAEKLKFRRIGNKRIWWKIRLDPGIFDRDVVAYADNIFVYLTEPDVDNLIRRANTVLQYIEAYILKETFKN